MKIKKHIKKPIPVEAVLLTKENLKEVEEWIIDSLGVWACTVDEEKEELTIYTPEGHLTARCGEHYIVCGVKGEFYPVEKEIFEETYEEA